MFKKFLSYFVSVIMLLVFVMPVLVQAQGTSNPNPGTSNPINQPNQGTIIIENPFNQGDDLYSFIKGLVNNILVPIGGVLAVIMIMYAGFLYVTAGGAPAQITKARDALLWAVIGAAILLGAWVIANAIEATIKQLK